MNNGWIGVDLDGTLARYTGWNNGEIGEPIPAMVDRVKQWLAEGQEVRIFTARVSRFYSQPTAGVPLAIAEEALEQMDVIQSWCLKHIGQRLKVTSVKDFAMIRLYDDRCVQVEANTGRLIGEAP